MIVDKELLDHLEAIGVYKQPEKVPNVVEQYVTNMMQENKKYEFQKNHKI